MNFNILDNVLTVSLALIREQGRAETFVVTHVSSTRGMSHLPLASHPTDVLDKKSFRYTCFEIPCTPPIHETVCQDDSQCISEFFFIISNIIY